MQSFRTAPLDVLDLARYIEHKPRSHLGDNLQRRHADPELPFEVSAHPEAKSKVAIDMIARLRTDVIEYASQHNSSLLPRCTFLADAESVVADGAVRVEAETSLRELLGAIDAATLLTLGGTDRAALDDRSIDASDVLETLAGPTP